MSSTNCPTLDDVIQDLRGGMDRLRGRLFEQIEATGMAERQELAVKRVIRRVTYDMQGDLESSLRRSRGHLEVSDA